MECRWNLYCVRFIWTLRVILTKRQEFTMKLEDVCGFFFSVKVCKWEREKCWVQSFCCRMNKFGSGCDVLSIIVIECLCVVSNIFIGKASQHWEREKKKCEFVFGERVLLEHINFKWETQFQQLPFGHPERICAERFNFFNWVNRKFHSSEKHKFLVSFFYLFVCLFVEKKIERKNEKFHSVREHSISSPLAFFRMQTEWI